MEWCEHIYKSESELMGYEGWIFKVGSYVGISKDWKLCPICGAKRPEKKWLWQRLKDKDEPGTDYGLCAEEAKLAFREAVNNCQEHETMDKDEPLMIGKNEILTRIEEL